MSKLDVFVAPRPNAALIRAMTAVNRVVMLRGVPVLRDMLPFSRLAGLRGIANVRHIDFPDSELARLAAVCGTGKATFITPNHPEFFTDWMIDKEIISHVSPLAACWATHGVVNGLGRLMQRFWLANNLIAQIPGNSEAARRHSIGWALKGHGVLLHPEGGVGWHGNFVAPLLPGAVEMGIEALRQGRAAALSFEAWIAPVVWKLVFLDDVEPELAAECSYVERRLDVCPRPDAPLPERVFHIYETLVAREEETSHFSGDRVTPLAERVRALASHLGRRLRDHVPDLPDDVDAATLLRLARRRLRDRTDSDPDARCAVEVMSGALQRLLRLGAFAFASAQITQEEIAEHLKRLRNDHCKGSPRDTLNRFVPQPAGPRRAYVRVPDPLPLHCFEGSVAEALDELRRRMQRAVDEAVHDHEAAGRFISYHNPFYHSGSAASCAPGTAGS